MLNLLPLVARPTLSGKLVFFWVVLLMCCIGSMRAAVPSITSATNVDIYYDAENPGDQQFAYRVLAADATVYDATGLPPAATIDPTSGWINGSRNVPGVYRVIVRALNADGVADATVQMAIHPAVTGVRCTAGIFHAGQTISFTLHFNTAVWVAGSPHLTLAIGGTSTTAFKDAAYVSGSGSAELIFQYVVAAGDGDPDGVQLLPTAPTGGSIKDQSGLSVSPTLPVRHFASGITIVTDGITGPANAAAPGAAPSSTGALANVSARMRVVEGDASRSLIAGFVITGSKAKRVLLRAIGPTLSVFGVSGALPDPQLRLYSSTGSLVTENDNWSGLDTSAAAAGVGAFALAAGTRDSASVVTLPPGAYTLVVAPNGGDGVALAEVYDADADVSGGASAVINLSTRGQVDGDGSALIAGFAVRGAGNHRFLVRGIGPTLAKFGVSGALLDPELKIYQDGRLVAQNDDWNGATAEVASSGTASGAFALTTGSKDAALVLTLQAGAYTAVVSGVGNTSGAGMVEVYELPANDQPAG